MTKPTARAIGVLGAGYYRVGRRAYLTVIDHPTRPELNRQDVTTSTVLGVTVAGGRVSALETSNTIYVLEDKSDV